MVLYGSIVTKYIINRALW